MGLLLKRRNLGVYLFTFLLYLSSAIFFTFPLAKQFASHIPIGTESSGTVPFLNIWILKWNLIQFLDMLPDYWNAPILFPSPGSFAFSEPQPLAGLLLLPLNGVGSAISYNSLLLFYFVANGVSAYWLFRYSHVSRALSFLGGLWTQMLPFLSHERGVVQLLPIFPFFLALIASVHLLRSKSLGRASLLALIMGGTFYLSENYGLILGIVVLSFAAYSPFSSWKTTRLFLFAGLLALVLALPLILPQTKILDENSFERSDRSIAAGSANLDDYVKPSQTVMASLITKTGNAKFGLYPGLALTGLGLLGLIYLFNRNRSNELAKPLAFSLLLSFLLSFGLHLKLFDWQPYAFIADNIPGFEHLRSPFRFGIWVQISLLIFAIHFLHLLLRKGLFWQVSVLVVVASLEIFPLPARLTQIPAFKQLTGVESPAVFLPYVQGTSASAYTQTTRYMLLAQDSGTTIVNGYSGYLPQTNADLKRKLSNFPDEASLEALRRAGVKSVLVVADWLIEERKVNMTEFVEAGLLIPAGEQAGYLIFEFSGEMQ